MESVDCARDDFDTRVLFACVINNREGLGNVIHSNHEYLRVFDACAAQQVNSGEIPIEQPVTKLFDEFDMCRIFIHRCEGDMTSPQKASNYLPKAAETGDDHLGLMRVPISILIGLFDAAAAADAAVEGHEWRGEGHR